MARSRKSYYEVSRLHTFQERYQYLRLRGVVGKETFGFDRYLNQAFYTSSIWKSVRDKVIIRDEGCDLGIEGYPIFGKVIIHHLNPITSDELEHDDRSLLDLDNLICTSPNTHNAIHFGDERLLPSLPKERRPGDTLLW